jgi:hypothetical protein
VFPDCYLSSLHAGYHENTELPGKTLCFALWEKSVMIGYRNRIEPFFLCLLHQLPWAGNGINGPVGMGMEIDFHELFTPWGDGILFLSRSWRIQVPLVLSGYVF